MHAYIFRAHRAGLPARVVRRVDHNVLPAARSRYRPTWDACWISGNRIMTVRIFSDLYEAYTTSVTVGYVPKNELHERVCDCGWRRLYT